MAYDEESVVRCRWMTGLDRLEKLSVVITTKMLCDRTHTRRQYVGVSSMTVKLKLGARQWPIEDIAPRTIPRTGHESWL